MWKRALQRLTAALITLILVGAATFALARWSVGDPLDLRLDPSAMTRYTSAQREVLEKQFRLDLPWWEQYGLWARDFVQGDWGRSFRDRRPVRSLVAARLPVTLALNACALFWMLAIAVPAGIWSALRAGSRFDRTSMIVSLALFAVPSFWLAMMLQEAFAIRLHWLPLYGLGESGAGLFERLRHLVLPSFALAVGGIAYVARFLRAHLLESRPAALLRGARARGRGMLGVFMVHGFRRSALPLLTLAGFLLPGLLSGSVLIETVFSIPGLGRLFYEAVLERDLPVLTVLVGISGVATLLGMLLADLLYLWAEPRLRERGDA